VAHVIRSLDPLFHPRSVAVIGATPAPGSVGSILMRNLLGNPFGGGVYPVNPKRPHVHGVHCYPSLVAVPEPIDLAVIATPAATVSAVVREAAERGVKAAIIISAGFSELGAGGRKLEDQVRATARGRMRLLGPNCLGVLHPLSGLNASFAASMALPGKVALLSQSGAICTSILDWANAKHIGFSAFVSVGAMADVDFADLLDYFGDDVNTQSIILYMESIGDVRKFLSAARNVARAKTVIVIKAGRTEAAAKAAASHTGALAGSDAVFDAAFRRAGVLRVNTIGELFSMSEILALQPRPAGPGLAIITNAGGPGVMATDALIGDGGQLAELSPATRAALDAALPPFWSHANPIDILGDAGPNRYRQVVEACIRDPNVQGILILLTPQAMTDPTETARQLAPFGHTDGKPVLASWMGGTAVRTGRDILSAAGIPTFDSPEAAIRAFLYMVQYRRNQELLYERPEALPEVSAPDAGRVRRILAAVCAAGRTLLTEAEAKDVLDAYGIPVTPTIASRTEEEAVAAARRLGYPVVLKLLSTTITHKSDVGGVQLNLTDDAAVRAAFRTIAANFARTVGSRQQAAGSKDSSSSLPTAGCLLPTGFEGVTVQPMVRDKGYELIVGSSIDQQFGPVILFGSGGVLVEVLRDRALAFPPLTRTLARRLIERTRIFEALRGVRGQAAVPLERLETLLVNFSQLVADFLEISEIDINPLLAGPERIIALDARIVLCPPDLPAERRPRLAIRPYPNQYAAPWRLRDGTEVIVRPIRAEDEPLILKLFATFSEHTIRMRFFSMLKRLSHESLIRLCHLDYEREMALVAVHHINGEPSILGVSRYYLDPETGAAEFAIAVGDPWQGQGLGYHLMRRLIDVARQNGVERLVGQVLQENVGMLRFVEGLGFDVRPGADSTVAEAVLDLSKGRA
jgi:acetyltransferase